MSDQQQAAAPAPAPSGDRGASIIQTAIKIMAAGQSKGWSDALAQAAKLEEAKWR